MNEKIDMGHGQMVDVATKSHGEWELSFSEAGVVDYKAPRLDEIQVDLIDAHGRLHPATISVGSNASSVKASAHVHDAYRIRIRVMHGTHFHMREGMLPDGRPPAPTKGANGGAIATFDEGLSVEVRSVDPEIWELFFAKAGAAISPPAADDVAVQAIGPRAEGHQFRSLKPELSPSGTSLLATGKIKDAAYAHIVIKGEKTAARSVPI